MKLAAIDIGTNSTRLLICSIIAIQSGNKANTIPIIREMKITRLGRNLEKSGRIGKKSAADTTAVLKEYIELIKKYNVKKYRALGTRVLRHAENADWFLSYVKKQTGINIEIVSGLEEAKLSFKGVINSIDLDSFFKKTFNKLNQDNNESIESKKCQNILVIDIGGGSTEFILGDVESNIVLTDSIDIGSVNMTERFLDSKKPKKKQLEKLSVYLINEFKKITKTINSQDLNFIIGLAGTISTLAAVDLKLREYDRNKIHGAVLRLERVKDILLDLCSRQYKQRQNIPGLDPGRADIIIAGTVILIEIMKLLKKESLIVSECDILDGIIYSILQFC